MRQSHRRDNVAQNALNAYAELLKIGAVIGAIVVSVDSYRVQQDPRARPDAFTGADFKSFHDSEFVELQRQVQDVQQWRERHVQWGRQRAGRNDEMHRNLEGSVSDLKSQVLYLYQQHGKE